MHQRPTIFLAEDSPADCYLFQEALKAHHVETELFIFHDGEDAMAFLTSAEENGPQPQLFVIDLNLPKVDGKEILHFVKTDDHLKKIPVVMLTTSSLQKDIVYSYDNHANCYIVKPGNLKDFITAINSIEKFWTKCVTYPNKN